MSGHRIGKRDLFNVEDPLTIPTVEKIPDKDMEFKMSGVFFLLALLPLCVCVCGSAVVSLASACSLILKTATMSP